METQEINFLTPNRSARVKFMSEEESKEVEQHEEVETVSRNGALSISEIEFMIRHTEIWDSLLDGKITPEEGEKMLHQLREEERKLRAKKEKKVVKQPKQRKATKKKTKDEVKEEGKKKRKTKEVKRTAG
jgi:outer membrane biosynthesis protein TonB